MPPFNAFHQYTIKNQTTGRQSIGLAHHTQQLLLQDILPLLVLLARLIRLVIFPSYRLLALPARDIPNHMSSGRHAPFNGFRLDDVDDRVEEECFAMLASKILPARSSQTEGAMVLTRVVILTRLTMSL